MRILKIILYAIATFIGLSIITGFILGIVSGSWQAKQTANQNKGANTLVCPWGKLEYALIGDEGPVVLVSHALGTGYNEYNQHMWLVKQGYRLLVPSRFGYGQTDLPTDATPQNQAKVFAQLLDSLQITQVGVLGVSAGTMAAIEFANLYPERIKGLALNSPFIVPVEDSVWANNGFANLFTNSRITRNLLLMAAGYLAVNDSVTTTGIVLDLLGPTTGNARNKVKEYVLTNARQRQLMRDFVTGLAPVELRVEGFKNDIAQLSSYNPSSVKDIAMPILMCGAVHDKIAPLADNLKVLASYKQTAQVIELEYTGHMCLLGEGRNEYQRLLTAFLKHAVSTNPIFDRIVPDVR